MAAVPSSGQLPAACRTDVPETACSQGPWSFSFLRALDIPPAAARLPQSIHDLGQSVGLLFWLGEASIMFRATLLVCLALAACASGECACILVGLDWAGPQRRRAGNWAPPPGHAALNAAAGLPTRSHASGRCPKAIGRAAWGLASGLGVSLAPSLEVVQACTNTHPLPPPPLSAARSLKGEEMGWRGRLTL